MPPLQIEGFTATKPDNFGGLYQAAETVERKEYRDQKMKGEGSSGVGSANFLMRYLDPKDHLTGTVYDPEIVKGFNELLTEGMALSSKGADMSTLMMALAPRVNKLSEYSTKAKTINARVKEQLGYLPADSGYIKHKLEEAAKKAAFFDDEGKMRDISTLEVDKDYISEAIDRDATSLVDPTHLKKILQGDKLLTETKSLRRKNSKGGSEYRKTVVSGPGWMVFDEEADTLVPEYEIAKDGDKPLLHNGKPVRMVSEGLFNRVMADPSTLDRYQDLVKKQIGSDDLTKPQAKNVAKALLYQELSDYKFGSLGEAEAKVDDPYRSPRSTTYNYFGGGGGGSASRGNEFDRLDGISFKSGDYIKQGVVYSKSGTPANGPKTIRKDQLPAQLLLVLEKAGYDFLGKTLFDIEVKNGVIESLKPSGGNVITRSDMENAQLKFDSEPQKSQRLTFGDRPQPKTQPQQQQKQTQFKGVPKGGF